MEYPPATTVGHNEHRDRPMRGMEHHSNCRCDRSSWQAPMGLNNNNNTIPSSTNFNGMVRQTSSAHSDRNGPGPGNANTHTEELDDQSSHSNSYGGSNIDSDDSMTQLSYASSMWTSHDRPCYVTMRTCTCTALSYAFCLKDTMGCLGRSVAAFMWLVLISLVCNMVTRYAVYTDTSYIMASGDMRLMERGLSTIFCSSNNVDGLPNGYSSEYISYLLPWKPPVIPRKSYNQTIQYHSVALAPSTYKYYQFYFLKGSVVSLTFKVVYNQVTFMALKGEDMFHLFKKSPNCGYECAFYMTSRTSGNEKVRFSFSVYDNNEFYFVFMDGFQNWRTGSEFSVDFEFQRTRYDLTYVKSSCAAGLGSCSYELVFGSTERVAIVIPESAESSMSITSSCKPRSLIYAIFFVLTPFSIIMLVSVIIYTTSKLCRCLSPRHIPVNQTLEESTSEYDIMPTFDNLTVTENTPLLNPTLPSYDQAVSERLAEDFIRAEPPPSYHAAVNQLY